MDNEVAEATESLLRSWSEAHARGEAVCVARDMAALTLTVITRALFGVDLGDEVREIGEMVNRTIAFKEKISGQRATQSMHELDAVVYRIILQRRNGFQDMGDLLSSMILARDGEMGEAMSDEQFRNQVVTLLLVGFDTTASALTCMWYLLAQNPDAFKRLQAEPRRVLGGRRPQYTDLESLSYTRQVIDEGLRMYPPAWTLGRHALGGNETGGYYIGPGSTITINLYKRHRHPGFWKLPDTFDPDRFSLECSIGRHKFALVPFGAGPR